MKSLTIKVVFFMALFCILFTTDVSHGAENVRNPDGHIKHMMKFFVDPPTLHCLGFRWYIGGDDDADATGKLRYRKLGEAEWKQALPMLRVNREIANRAYQPYASENLLAGSIFSLEPDTEYEVHCTVTDPDGGERGDTTMVVRTWQEPVAPEPVRTLHLYPPSYRGKHNGYTSLSDLVKDLRSGDLVLIYGGVHPTGDAGIVIETDGTKERPIVFRGAGDREAIIQGEFNATIFDLRDRSHLFFEDLTIRGRDRPENRTGVSRNSYAFYAEGASWLTVRNCRVEKVRNGIRTISEHSVHWYIADNIITGYNPEWYPRIPVKTLYETGNDPAHTGINIYGRGHVVCHNRVSRFWDCVAIADHGRPSNEPDLKCVAIDMYNNDLSDAIDDGLETDYGCHNIRVFNNRIINVHTGMSAQPTYGGPIYFIRNELYNITSLSLKFHNYCTGLEVYHNTIMVARHGFQSSTTWQNGIFRNNLFLGFRGCAVITGSAHPKTSLDYNGYHSSDSECLIRWDDGTGFKTYATLDDFYEGTGFEKHGILVDIDIFEKADPPIEGKTYKEGSMDLSLKAGSAPVNRGVLLNNINDGHTGKGPDLGCYETGRPKPQYGPRERAIQWDDPDHAHTKMFHAYGERFRHWSWFRVGDVRLSPGKHKLVLSAAGGTHYDALVLLPQTGVIDRAAMDLFQNWNYAPWRNPL